MLSAKHMHSPEVRLSVRRKVLPYFVLCTASLVFVSAWVIRAQQPPATVAQTPTFRADVDVVQVDVTVLDRKTRRPVTGLDASDFTVLENGQSRPIVGLTAITLPPPPPPSTAAWTDVAPDVVTNAVSDGRLVVVLLDRSIRVGWGSMTARRIASAVFESLGPHDLTAVIHTGALADPQNFTADRSLLLKAIESKAIGVNDRPYCSFECATCEMDAIRDVANALAEVGPRQKVMFFIGGGLKGFDGGLEDDAERWAARCTPTYLKAMREMLTATQRANLVIYPVGPGGVLPPGGPFSASTGKVPSRLIDVPDNPGVLMDLAAATGGHAVFNDNEPALEVPSLVAETGSYYLLGFTPGEAPADGRPRRIEIAVNRPDVEVRSRRSYYPPNAATPVTPRPAANTLPPALANMLPTPTMPLAMSLVPLAPAEDDRVMVAVVVGVEPRVLEARDRSADDAITLRVMAFDTQGREQASTRARIEAGDVDTDEPYDVVARLELRPGRYEVRTALDVPGVEGTGSVYGYVEVPNLRREHFTLSGPFLTLDPGRPAYVAEDLEAVLPASPTAQRTVASTDHAAAVLRVHQDERRTQLPVIVTMAIVDAQDEVVADDRIVLDATQFLEPRSADAVFELPLAQLSAGEYFLRLTATVGESSPDPTTRERTMRFWVR